MSDSNTSSQRPHQGRDVRNGSWSVRRIKDEMGITNTQYITIYNAVEDAMQAFSLLEQPLNTKQKRNKLYNATTQLYTQFHAIFTDLTDVDKEQYIQAVAQRCNHNKKQ